MPRAGTYKAHTVVLRKTKLGEKDLIVTMLSESGEIVRAVAKGARKPGSSLAAKLELFSVVDCLLAHGRSLDVVTEARFAKGHDVRTFGLEQSACASALAELLANVAQEGLEQPRLFHMTVTALDAIARSDERTCIALCAAALFKALSMEGFRPSFDACASCGRPLDEFAREPWTNVSLEDGGALCDDCARGENCIHVPPAILKWTHALIYARFDEIGHMDINESTSLSVLQLARQWARTHTGRNLKSLDFIFAGWVG